MAVGGDIIEATYNHPTIGSGVIYAKAAGSSSYNIGGYRSADEENMIDGQGTMIDKMNRVRPGFTFEAVNDMSQQTIEKVVQMASSPVPATWTFQIVNGTQYQMTGKPVGELNPDIQESTFELKIQGSNMAKQII